MSNPGQPQDTPQVEVVANPNLAGNSAFSSGKNQALELAGSLASLSDAGTQFAGAYAKQAQEVARADAQKKAIENKGLGFAEAVRQGKIDPTASPWWMTAYKQESAKVQTLAAVDQLNVDAASWQEQNDPAAYQKKYTEGLAEIGKNFQDPEEKLGFEAAAGPAQERAFAANTEKNVQEITASRIQNLSALSAKAVMDVISKNGGNATGAQVTAALEPLKQQWLTTGGRLPDWNQKVALPAIQAAAFETWNPKVIDLAKAVPNGQKGGSLYDEQGAAEQLETIRHRIDQDNRQQLSLQMQAEALRRERDQYSAQGDLFKLLGPKLFTGGASQDDIVAATSQLAGKHQPAAIASALRTAAEIGNSYREIAADKASLYGQSGPGSQHLATLHQEATTTGWTPEFGDEVGRMALQGDISVATQDQLVDLARKRSLALSTKAGVQPNAPSVFNAQAANINDWRKARTSITGSIVSTTKALSSRSGIQLTPGEQQALQDAAINAATDHLLTTKVTGGKKDFAGAQSAANAAAAAWLNDYIKRLAPVAGGKK